MKIRLLTSLSLVAIMFGRPALPDVLEPNPLYVKTSDDWGTVYLRAIPKQFGGEVGTTSVFRVQKTRDKRICTFPWYSLHAYLYDLGTDVSIVRQLFEKSKQHPSGKHIHFYLNEKLLKTYSIEDLVTDVAPALAEKVRKDGFTAYEDVRFTRVISSIEPPAVRYEFQIKWEHRVLYRFDASTGEIISKSVVAN